MGPSVLFCMHLMLLYKFRYEWLADRQVALLEQEGIFAYPGDPLHLACNRRRQLCRCLYAIYLQGTQLLQT